MIFSKFKRTGSSNWLKLLVAVCLLNANLALAVPPDPPTPLPVPSSPVPTTPGSPPPPPPATPTTPTTPATPATPATTPGPSPDADFLGADRDLLSRLTPNAKQWFRRTVNFVEGKRGDDINIKALTYGEGNGGENGGPNLFKAFINIGWAFTFALFVYAIVNANYFYRSDDYWKILGRLIIAVALISGTPAISKSLGNNWAGVHDFTQSAFASNTNSRLAQAIGSIGASLPSFLLGLEALDKISELTDGGFTLEGSLEQKESSNKARAAAVIRIALTVIVVMYAIHTLTIYSTALILILAMLFLPIVASLLLLPSTASYITRWVSMVLTAFAALIVGIVVYAMAMDIAFIIPLNNLEESIKSVGGSITNYISAIIPDFDKIGQNANIFEALGNYANEIGTSASGVISAGVNTVALFLFNAIFIVVGMIVGVFLLVNFERMVAGFFGGVAAAGANAALGAAGFALGQLSSAGGGSGAGSGGGGSSSGQLSANSSPSASNAGGLRANASGSSGGGSPALPAGTGGASEANNVVSSEGLRRGSPTSGGGGASTSAASATEEVAEVVAENPEVLAAL